MKNLFDIRLSSPLPGPSSRPLDNQEQIVGWVMSDPTQTAAFLRNHTRPLPRQFRVDPCADVVNASCGAGTALSKMPGLRPIRRSSAWGELVAAYSYSLFEYAARAGFSHARIAESCWRNRRISQRAAHRMPFDQHSAQGFTPKLSWKWPSVVPEGTPPGFASGAHKPADDLLLIVHADFDEGPQWAATDVQ